MCFSFLWPPQKTNNFFIYWNLARLHVSACCPDHIYAYGPPDKPAESDRWVSFHRWLDDDRGGDCDHDNDNDYDHIQHREGFLITFRVYFSYYLVHILSQTYKNHLIWSYLLCPNGNHESNNDDDDNDDNGDGAKERTCGRVAVPRLTAACYTSEQMVHSGNKQNKQTKTKVELLFFIIKVLWRGEAAIKNLAVLFFYH